MRRLTALIAQTFNRRDVAPLPPPQVPMSAVVRERINRAFRRRLSDRVVDVFQEACISGDLDTAEELVVVLEALHVRRQTAAGDRRISNQDVVNAREELAGRRAERAAAAAAAAEAEAEAEAELEEVD